MNELLHQLINLALLEDVGDGDHTSLACIPAEAEGTSRLLVKQKGIIAGVHLAKQIIAEIDSNLHVEVLIEDGNHVEKGDIAFYVTGKIQSILKAERLVLNVMQHMSGIATETRLFVDELKGLDTKILDTRKTSPGLRMIEKEAVKIGGGENHRMGLYDMIMIKDNHIDFAGGIENAINRTQAYLRSIGKKLPIEVEARSLDDVQKIIDTGNIQRIMFDNFTTDNTLKAVALVDHKFETESSGGITLNTIRKYAECGVDYISVGALTHHVSSLDLSLKAVN